MEREIKFRAFQDGQMLTSPISSNYGLSRFFGLLYEDAPVMQYTGLKDKNGKEIYEGDILMHKLTEEIKKVCFEDGAFGIQRIFLPFAPFYGFSKDFFGLFEVIGNIYENPNL